MSKNLQMWMEGKRKLASWQVRTINLVASWVYRPKCANLLMIYISSLYYISNKTCLGQIWRALRKSEDCTILLNIEHTHHGHTWAHSNHIGITFLFYTFLRFKGCPQHPEAIMSAHCLHTPRPAEDSFIASFDIYLSRKVIT